MMRYHLIVTTLAIALAPSVGFAQGSTIGGAAAGAAAGAVVGGPPGAVIGGAIGGTIGMAAEPPAEVRSYVVRERAPSVRIDQEVVVGEPLPPTVVLRTIPQHNEYRYAIVNEKRVIVEPSTRRVVQIIE
jgi:hypothetical protein